MIVKTNVNRISQSIINRILLLAKHFHHIQSTILLFGNNQKFSSRKLYAISKNKKIKDKSDYKSGGGGEDPS